MTDTNQNKEGRTSRVQFWGAGIILLMIVLMLFPINLGNPVSGGAGSVGTVIGTTANGGELTSDERASALRLLESLESIYVMLPSATDAQHIPLATAIWGEAAVRDFRQNPEALALLLRESAATGPGASPQALGPFEVEQRSTEEIGLMNSGRIPTDVLQPLPGSPLATIQQIYRQQLGFALPVVQLVVPRTDPRGVNRHVSFVAPSDLPPLEQERVYAAVRELLTIQTASTLLTGAIKPSQPIVDRIIAERGHVFDLQVAAISAEPRFANVPEPTDAQLLEQLKAFAEKPVNTVDRDNPFGFGYRIPDRVTLEMISFKKADVRKLVESEKTPYEWEVAARMAFAADSSAFATRPPTTNPGDPAATGPATRPSFEDVKATAIAMAIDAAAQARAAEIERRIRSTMALDFQSWIAAQAQKAPTPTSSYGVPYDSGEYLDRLAADIQSKFKLLPSIARYNDTPRDRATLGLLGSFGRAQYPVPDAVRRKLGLPATLDGPTYATEFARDLMPPRLVASAGEAALERYEPSETVVTNTADAETFIFRLTGTEPDRAATEADLAALRPRLVYDWKLAQAQKQVRDEAAAAAEKQSPSAELTVPGANVINVQVGPFGDPRVPIPPALGLDQAGYLQFGQEVTDKLLTDPQAQPVTVLDVPLARRAYVARRVAMKPTWSSASELAELRMAARSVAADELAAAQAATSPDGRPGEAFGTGWLDVKQIFERNQWKPSASETAER